MKVTIESKKPMSLTYSMGKKVISGDIEDQFTTKEWNELIKEIDCRKKAKITITIEQE